MKQTPEIHVHFHEHAHEYDQEASELALGRMYLAIRNQLLQMEERIMSKFTEFLTESKAWHEQDNASWLEMKSFLDNIQGDVQQLTLKLEELAESPQDTQLMEDIQGLRSSLSQSTQNAMTLAREIDDQTPPVIPPAP